MATVPWASTGGVLLAAMEANLTTSAEYQFHVSLEEVSSTTRSYLITFPPDLGDAATMLGYGTSEILAVTVVEEVQGGLQVSSLTSALMGAFLGTQDRNRKCKILMNEESRIGLYLLINEQ